MSTKKRLLVILAVGLLLRAGLLIFFWDQPLTIVDETHYQRIAENILNHHEFSYKVGQPHALRPPLFPFFLSAIYLITGGVHFNSIRIAQILLSLGIIILLYPLGKHFFDRRIGLLASFIFAVYPSFIFFTHLLLTEVLFTFFLILFVYFFLKFLKTETIKEEEQTNILEAKRVTSFPLSLIFNTRYRNILLTGLFLGLGALTRSGLYPFLFIAIIFVFFVCRGMLIEKLRWASILTIGFILVVSPWAIRNYILFKDLVIIDTIGGLNLYLGNYEHTPLNRAWAAIDLTGDKTWFYGHEKELAKMNEAQKQRWAITKAREFILGHIGLTLKRDLIKAANFWGLEREVIGPIINGHWPRLNKTSYLIAITSLIFITYGLILACSVFGIMFQLQLRNKGILFCVALIVFFTGTHAIVFGHSRYHLPLMPLLALFASWSLINTKIIWHSRYTWKTMVSMIFLASLIGIWGREILFIEGARFLQNLHM